MDIEPRHEAERLVAAFDHQAPALLHFLSNQLGVLKNQAQLLMTLCGLTVSVTGFSGHNMVRAGLVSTLAMVAGIALTLGGLLLTLRILANLRWVSQDLDTDLVASATRTIARRNHEQHAVVRAGMFVAAGVAAYLVSVVAAAMTGGGAFSGPR